MGDVYVLLPEGNEIADVSSAGSLCAQAETNAELHKQLLLYVQRKLFSFDDSSCAAGECALRPQCVV
jgi:hypothetical protein